MYEEPSRYRWVSELQNQLQTNALIELAMLLISEASATTDTSFLKMTGLVLQLTQIKLSSFFLKCLLEPEYYLR